MLYHPGVDETQKAIDHCLKHWHGSKRTMTVIAALYLPDSNPPPSHVWFLLYSPSPCTVEPTMIDEELSEPDINGIAMCKLWYDGHAKYIYARSDQLFLHTQYILSFKQHTMLFFFFYKCTAYAIVVRPNMQLYGQQYSRLPRSPVLDRLVTCVFPNTCTCVYSVYQDPGLGSPL